MTYKSIKEEEMTINKVYSNIKAIPKLVNIHKYVCWP